MAFAPGNYQYDDVQVDDDLLDLEDDDVLLNVGASSSSSAAAARGTTSGGAAAAGAGASRGAATDYDDDPLFRDDLDDDEDDDSAFGGGSPSRRDRVDAQAMAAAERELDAEEDLMREQFRRELGGGGHGTGLVAIGLGAGSTGSSGAGGGRSGRVVERPAGMHPSVILPLLHGERPETVMVPLMQSLRDYVLPEDEGCRTRLGRLLESRCMEVTVVLLLLVDVVITTLELLAGTSSQFALVRDRERRRQMEVVSHWILAFFVLELTGLWLAYGWQFFHHKGYLIDVVVVPASVILELIVGNAGGYLVLLRTWRAFRTGIHICKAGDDGGRYARFDLTDGTGAFEVEEQTYRDDEDERTGYSVQQPRRKIFKKVGARRSRSSSSTAGSPAAAVNSSNSSSAGYSGIGNNINSNSSSSSSKKARQHQMEMAPIR